MKQFLLRNPANRSRIAQQEQQHANTLRQDGLVRQIRATSYPELAMPRHTVLQQSSEARAMLVMAQQRLKMKSVFKELLSLNLRSDEKGDADNFASVGRSTSKRNQISTWYKKAQGVFFYFHRDLGCRNLQLTCSAFGFNPMTFNNWISQPMYYAKWVSFVENFQVGDIIESIPQTYRDQFLSVSHESKVTLPPKFTTKGNKIYLTGFGTGTRQKRRKIAEKQEHVVYIAKNAKTLGSRRKIKYPLQAEFVTNEITRGWETGNPFTRYSCYDLLVSEYGSTDDEFSRTMQLTSGQIGPGLSQWLSRTIYRHGFSVRKESISQTVPLNWFTIATEAADQNRQAMSNANVSRLISMDEMFLNYYPKESHVIAPINSKRIGSNRKEDEKAGCTVVAACEMFESQLLSPFLVMDGTHDGYLARRYHSWEGDAVIKCR
ncbi:hypothetical protein AeRB84_015290 [Aphanomyces euteiches]|nr:hypothetical protein AeRB84_015290 [Aphanomyces euteiches]